MKISYENQQVSLSSVKMLKLKILFLIHFMPRLYNVKTNINFRWNVILSLVPCPLL